MNRLTRLILLSALPPVGLSLFLMLYFEVSYYLTALVVIILGAFIACLVATAQRGEADQLRTIAGLVEAVIEGDYSMRGKTEAGVYGEIVGNINHLAETLGKRNVQNRENELLLGKIMNQIDVAVLAVDEIDRIVLVNPAATRLIGKGEVHLKTLAQIGLSALSESNEQRIMELPLAGGQGSFLVYGDHFIEDGQSRRLIFITDVGRIIREEERKAWQNLLRVLSHEINNSLSPIASISDTLTRILSKSNEIDRDALMEGLVVIRERAQGLAVFIDCYKQFSRLPEPHKRSFELGSVFAKLATLFPHREILFDGNARLVIQADPNQFEQMMVNLLKNADEAMVQGEGAIRLGWEQARDQVILFIEDEGSGIANSENLFVPFYTTKEKGSGIGLVLCRQIAFNHGGTIELKNRPDGKGARVLVRLPHSEKA